MNGSGQVRIDVEAAKALAEWKSLFGAEVCEQAKRLAAESGQPNRVTLSQYRIAAGIAIQTLAGVVQGEYEAGGQAEAA